ncbi:MULTISPECIES: DUF3081 domain-containing protein [Pseudidiomarina]|uniref:DUF3081 family protein n=4 Tax=Pseudidiomarina TaxID=2800384 RepID=A0A368UJV5_9GAMM|nr:MULTISPECIES: DUF3081 domain-containing protein [Pseudidiomarina]MDT7526059.1 DUF3081 domain-containing protein [Pseudidiomarina sp. GXY010]MDX1526146.1 DUF3081 family protein [Pseudidiomarina maritima]PWW07576.1 hypothetical protein DET45_12721 [Pseudidiomarina maritima]RBP86757.1 DUF3081 family protein [Pseudidiomarina tainanensis]RCW28946.1 DUF3081 family protein [Pseudidiomarina tainanensis]
MKNEIDQRLVLDAYETIHEYGKAEQGKHTLEGISAYTDHDGYTVFLEGHGVRMTLEFHNKYHLDYENERQYEMFMRALENISQGHYEPKRTET